MKILVLNGGSSSLKARLWDVQSETLPADSPQPLWDARADWGRHAGTADVRVSTGAGDQKQIRINNASEVLEPVLRTLWGGKVIGGPGEIDVVGHRIVHGGKAFTRTTRISAEVKAEIKRLAEFAPEHNLLELESIEAAERVLGTDIPQIAVFDTAFHATLPPAANVYPGPYGWLADGIRRYGFHGISHQYVSRRAAEILRRDLRSLRMITCHLGNGCSLAAVHDGRSIDTTMGFTPLEGLVMGTRCGSIDPGIVIYLVRHCGYQADQLDRILNKESGLKGLSGLSGDMREIEAAMDAGNERAKLAFDVFVHRLCGEIGAMAASLGGLDALVFTAGIGENSARVREAACAQLAFLGIRLDKQKNARATPDADITAAGSPVRVLVIRTEEDWEIARECHRVMREKA
ncbi:MAG TPA: acetate kinase [Bryobacteraceae bacterium]|nr:acetate kinase [Bryobacteraceae bacterium]